MTFEEILKKVADQYQFTLKHNTPLEQQEIQQFLIQQFQAKRISFHEYSSESYIIAPGLSKHANRGNVLDPRFLTYTAQHHQPLSAEENGLCILHWLYKTPRLPQNHIIHHHLEKIAIEFHPKLPLPITGTWNNLDGQYRFTSDVGKINAEYIETHRGYYYSHTINNQSRIDLSISVNRRDIRSIRIKPELLGTGLLTSFFKDIGYEGLDKLVD